MDFAAAPPWAWGIALVAWIVLREILGPQALKWYRAKRELDASDDEAAADREERQGAGLEEALRSDLATARRRYEEERTRANNYLQDLAKVRGELEQVRGELKAEKDRRKREHKDNQNRIKALEDALKAQGIALGRAATAATSSGEHSL